jgi:flagellar assembly protein FliH
MSTSSSAARQRAEREVASFSYQELNLPNAGLAVDANASDTKLQDEQKVREANAHEAGRREGEAHAHAEFALQIDEMRHSLSDTIGQFARERHEYYVRVERELVQLALSITRKILHRESSIDPLLLAGMVRVLLERMEQSSKISLRVNPSQASEFRAFFARHLPEKQPDVIEDAELASGICVIQTELGKTEVGPEVQLKEIEQGLLDLQAAKPKEKV